ncbi:nectin-4-like isoform X1 [Arapaima gigas]
MALSLSSRDAARLALLLLLLCAFAHNLRGEFLEPPLSFSLHAMAETQTQLPCIFLVQEGEVVQVTWIRERPDGTKDQVITAHRTEGHTEFGQFSGRVRFRGSDPMKNASLVIHNTKLSDEGIYTCHISTFPSGNFERKLSLAVWTKPISAVEPVELLEGQSLRVAATCRSQAHPLPSLSWDTDLKGQAQNHSLIRGVVSVTFSVEPLRAMNGKRLDCLVWHPSLQRVHRIPNRLIVHYPPEAKITGYDQQWFVGLEHASLECASTGNPKPQNFTWNRYYLGGLPDGVSVEGDRLRFVRPLRDTDKGIYECAAKSSVGTARDSIEIKLSESRNLSALQSPAIIIMCGIAGALLTITVLSVVTVMCYYRHRKKKLETELIKKTEEMVSLSRQNSMRRLNSISSDPRIQMEDNIPLRPKSALSSHREFRRRADSCSSHTGRRRSRAGGELDAAMPPMLYDSSWLHDGEGAADVGMDREQVQSRLRAESLRNHKTSLVGGMISSRALRELQPLGSRDQLSSARTSMVGVEGLEHVGSQSQLSPARSSLSASESSRYSGSRANLASPAKPRENWQDQKLEDTEGEDEDVKNIGDISHAMLAHFHYSNGIFQPKRHSNAILLDPIGQIV